MEKVSLEFAPGMTAFTGETGAGKSILIDALGAVFGTRASSDWVRHGAERAEVTATWEGEDARIATILADQEIEPEDELILRRIIGADGRSRAFVNGTQVPMRVLQEIGNVCLDLHGQHEHQVLLQPEFQRSLLDAHVEPSLLETVASSYRSWRQARERLASLQHERGDTEKQAAWMSEELERLHGLAIEEGLAESLQAEVDAGRNHAQIQQAAAQALELFDEGEPSARQLSATAAHAIDKVADFNPGLREAADMAMQLDAIFGELGHTLRNVLDASFDEAALLAAEERLMRLHEAMRRHKTDEAGLLALMEEWEERLSALDTAGWDEESLGKAVAETTTSYRHAAEKLAAARAKAGEQLVKEMRPFLDRLSLGGMQVRFDVVAAESESEWSVYGWDGVQAMVMSNPGEPWRPLASVASGGELSRLVLALKGCGALRSMPHIAVFDEVDTGIGGETAWCVGQLLAAMGQERQVFVISHLPQVASCAGRQVVIRKQEKDGRTVTHLEALDGESRQQEIARMLGGVDQESLEHARRMLGRGQEAR